MNIYLKEHNDITIIELSGELNLNFVPMFVDVVETLLSKNKKKILVKLDNIIAIDSAGLGSLIAANMSLHLKGCSFKVLGISSQVKRLFDLNSLQDYIEVYSDERIALDSFAKRSL